MDRPKRQNAGNRMAQLLEKEDEDDFYKTVYGGFKEEENDDEYESGMEDSSDVSDSDISVSEDHKSESESSTSDGYQNESKPSRMAVVKQAIKRSINRSEKETVIKPKQTRHFLSHTPENFDDNEDGEIKYDRISVRQSTQAKSEAAKLNQVLSEQKTLEYKEKYAHRRRYLIASRPPPTQAERLEQARQMEAINLASLENFQYQEAEIKKKARSFKSRKELTHFIRFLSTSVPIAHKITDSQLNNETLNTTFQAGNDNDLSLAKETKNYLIFSDKESLDNYFKPSTIY